MCIIIKCLLDQCSLEEDKVSLIFTSTLTGKPFQEKRGFSEGLPCLHDTTMISSLMRLVTSQVAGKSCHPEIFRQVTLNSYKENV